MVDSKQEQISQLLREGLDLYGNGEEQEAIEVWHQVLELDPENIQARDFLQTATREGAGMNEVDAAVRELMDDARQLMASGEVEVAMDLLRGGLPESESHLEIEALIELARVCLVAHYRKRLGGLSYVPLPIHSERLNGYNLPPDAGFLLSMFDGSTPLSDLVTLSGMEAFDALRTLSGLAEAGILEIPE